MSGFILGNSSLAELNGCDPRLVSVVKRAIEITNVDFVVHDGIRTLAEQKRYFDQRFSKTMKSKHLEGRAVDLVPWIEGKPRWWWPQIYQIAAAMHVAAREVGVGHAVTWGCVWDRPMTGYAQGITDLDGLADAMKAEGLAYNVRHAGSDFPDGPHYEVARP